MELQTHSAESDATPGGLPIPGSNTRRWQFSLKTLFVVTTLAAVVAAWAVNPMLFWPAYVAASRTLPFVLVVILCLILFRDQPLAGQHAVAAICTGGLLSLLFWWIGRSAVSAFGTALWYVFKGQLWTMFAPLPGWFLAWLLWRVLRRTPQDFSVQHTRQAALASLLVGVPLLGATRWLWVANFSLAPGEMRTVGFDDAALCLAVVGGLVCTIPWIKLLRRHARRLRPGYGPADTVAKLLLVSSMSLAAFSWLAMVLFCALGVMSPPGATDGGIGAAIFHELTRLIPVWIQCGGTILFLAGFLLELYRDRWHPRLTAGGGTHFGLYWLTVVIWPELLFLA